MESHLINGCAEIASFRSPYCWTDSKLRVFAFICVLAPAYLEAYMLQGEKANLEMSDQVLKMELTDIRQASLVYSPSQLECLIEEMSTVQTSCFLLFGLTATLPLKFIPMPYDYWDFWPSFLLLAKIQIV
jgi:hypothetical protein